MISHNHSHTMIKALLSLMLVCMFLFIPLFSVSKAATASSAATNEGKYETTKSFIDLLNKEEIKYTYVGMNEKQSEQVSIVYESQIYGELQFNAVFHKDEEVVEVYLWNLVKVSAGKNFVLSAMNSLNEKYIYGRFYLDENDNTINCDMSAFVDQTTAGDVTYKIMQALTDTVLNDDIVSVLLSLT